MVEVDAKSISLFFFFALLDESRATEATISAIKNYKERVSRNPELRAPVALIMSTYHVWDKHRNRFVRGRHNVSSASGWTVPEGTDLGPWKEFQKTAQEDEFLAMIWSQILKISDEDVALGLMISIGTLRYRVGRALRKLGQLTNPVQTKSQSPRLGVVRDE